MTKRIFAFLFCLLLFTGSAFCRISVIPEPQKIIEKEGCFVFNAATGLYIEDSRFAASASDLQKYLRRSAEITLLPVKKQQKKNTIELIPNKHVPAEGYEMKVSPEKIRIEAADHAGFFYAIQTLLQLLPPEIYAEAENNVKEWTVPAVEISDAPRFSYRGCMLDVSRFFTPKKDILKLLDNLAMHKINTFHWHLVDDNGWRIEIKKYPLLTSIGAFRAGRESIFPLRTNQTYGEPTPVGGYYTQDDIREVVAYARERNIEVIPEIEMPAHTNSSLAAYPHLACPVVHDFLGTVPGGGGKNGAAVYCAGNDSVFTFLEDVIDEVIALFPSKYVHIGGDEASKVYWKQCPLCQQRMKEHQIPNEEELQSYFIRRMNTYLNSKGKKLMGWDELVNSELPEGATIFGWRGIGQWAAKAAQKGHDVVLTPAQRLYLIRYQGPQWFEPITYFGPITLKDVYDYDMSMSGITPGLEKHVLGYQVSMWTEFVTNTQNLEYMLFPRLAAIADISWSSKPKDWTGFLQRLDKMTEVYKLRDVNYAHSMFNLFHQVETKGDRSYVTLSCIRPDVQICYTTDGTIPTAESTVYNASPVVVLPHTLFQARTFKNGKPAGDILKLIPIRNLATGSVIDGSVSGLNRLVNGILGSEKFTDGEHVDMIDQNLSFTLSLDSVKEISEISLGMTLNGGMAAHCPKSIRVSVSKDGVDFVPLTGIEIPAEIRFVNCIKKDRISLSEFQKTEAKYVKFEIERPGIVPDGYPREGQSSRMAFDEIYID